MSSRTRAKRTVGGLLAAALAVAGLAAIAGTVAWWNGWVVLVFVAVLGMLTSRLINRSPGLAEERRTAITRAQPWDVVLVRLVNLALPAVLVVGALDMRFRWLPAVPPPVSAVAFAGMVVAAAITYRAIAANIFFSSYIRIQEERGHAVVSTGPYRVVRHPGYAGAALFNLLVPLLLGSWTALLVGAAAAALLAYRTAREDRILAVELPGYAAYAARVRSRLIPGLW